MRPFSRSAKQASLFCSRLIKWLFLSVCRILCAKIRYASEPRKRLTRMPPPVTRMYTQQWLRRLTALRSRCARRSLDLRSSLLTLDKGQESLALFSLKRSLDLRSSLLTLDKGQASLALFSLKRSLTAASRQHGCEKKFLCGDKRTKKC